MLHLQKNEIVNDIKKLIKECANHQDIVELYKEALLSLDKHSEKPFKDYIKENYVIVHSFIYTLEKKKNCDNVVIDYIYTFLANSILTEASLIDISRILKTKSTWSEHEKMKILQMSFYLVRQEGFSPLSLFNYLCNLINDPNKRISSTARPITIQIVDYIFTQLDSKEPNLTLQDVTLLLDDDSKVVDIDAFIDSSKSNVNPVTELSSYISPDVQHDALNLLKDLYAKKSELKSLSLFYIDVLILIGQKKNVFAFQNIANFFTDFIFEDVNNKIVKGTREEKDKYILFIQIILEHHSRRFGQEIKSIFEIVEIITSQKDGAYILPLVSSLSDNIIKEHKETIQNILFNLLKHSENTTKNLDYFSCIFNLSEYLRKNDESAFERFSMQFLELFKNIKCGDLEGREVLLGNIIEFSLRSKNLEMFETIVHLSKSRQMEKFLLAECFKNRNLMENNWEVVFDNISKDIEDLDFNSFNGEDAYHLCKALTSNPTRWPLNDTLALYSLVLDGLLEPLKNQNNIKIIDLFAKANINLLETTESKEDNLLILSKYCKMVLDFTCRIEKLNQETQRHIIELLRNVLSLNVTLFGPLVLQSLHSLMRIYIPTIWEDIFLIIEMCTISHLHGDLFRVLDYIIEKYLDHIASQQILILFSCFEDIASGEDEILSNRAIIAFNEIGEVIISSRIVNNSKEDLWKTYLTTLYQFTNDARYKIRDKCVRILLQFILSDHALSNENESQFLVKEILIPLIEDKTKSIGSIVNDTKAVSSLAVLLEELNKSDCLRFTNIDYLKALLRLIERVLSKAGDSQVLMDLSLALLKEGSNTPNVSIQVYQQDYFHLYSQKVNKINFKNTPGNDDEINKHLFEFYKNMFLGFEYYPSYVFNHLLDGLRGFNGQFLSSNINIFDKILSSSNDVLVGKAVTTLCALDIPDDVVLNYLAKFITKDLTLATLILPNCTNKLRTTTNVEIICSYLIKIKEIGEQYDCLWERSVFYLTEASKIVKCPAVYDVYVEVSRSLFDEQLKKINDNPEEDLVPVTFQIYSNSQFSNYLEHDSIACEAKFNSTNPFTVDKTIEFRKKERLLLNYLVVYYRTICTVIKDGKLDEDRILKGFKLLLDLTVIKSNRPFTFYNLSFKSYHFLFESISLVYDELQKILKKVLKNYNEEAKLNNLMFSSIKQREIYLVFELLIEKKDKKLIESLKKEILNCLKNKDFTIVEYVRKNLMILYEE